MTEEEFIAKFRALDEDAKRRVLRTLEWEYEDTIEGRMEALRNDGKRRGEDGKGRRKISAPAGAGATHYGR